MNILMLVLRIIHICASILWGGGSLLMYFFLGPTIGATKQAGQQFAGHLMLKTKFVTFMTTMALSTVLTGVFLYLIDSHGLTSAWMTSASGLGFGVGGLFGLVGFISGAMFGNLNKRLARAGSQVQGQPTPEQLAQIQSIQAQIATASRFHTPAIIIAILLMSASRYLLF